MVVQRLTVLMAAVAIATMVMLADAPAQGVYRECGGWSEEFEVGPGCPAQHVLDSACFLDAPSEIKEMCNICADECEPIGGNFYSVRCFSTHEENCNIV